MSVQIKIAVVAVSLVVVTACDAFTRNSREAAPDSPQPTSLEAALSDAPRLDLSAAGRVIKIDVDDAGFRDSRSFLSSPRIRTAVIGTVGDVAPGPELGAFEGQTRFLPTTVLTVDVMTAFKGGARSGSKVYVQLFGRWDRDATLKTLPPGTVVVVYGSPVPEEPHTQHPSRGKPTDATFVRIGSIGLAVLAPQGGVVFPVRGDVHPSWGIEDLIPAKALTQFHVESGVLAR